VAGSGRLLTAIRRGGLADELLEMLRKAYGFGQPALWSLTLEAEAAICVPPPWFEQETVRGNFLRMIRDWHEQPRAEIDLTEYLPESYLAGSLSAAASVSDEQELRQILAEAAMLGVDLLTPEGPES
jgi:exonuclease SbcD